MRFDGASGWEHDDFVNRSQSFANLGRYLWRALLLKCPVCGRSPMFPKVLSIRRLSDWFTPLDGCPRCGYAYEREPGYFLLAIWAVNYGCGSLLGIVIYVVLELAVHPPLKVLLAAVLIPVVLFNFLFARHSKAIFLALDHFFDPHQRDKGDDSGNLPVDPPPQPVSPGDQRPDEPCETAVRVR